MVRFRPWFEWWEICAENRQEMPIWGGGNYGRICRVKAVEEVQLQQRGAPRAAWPRPCHRLESFLVLDRLGDGALYWECVLGGSFIEPTPVKPGPALSSDVTP